MAKKARRIQYIKRVLYSIRSSGVSKWLFVGQFVGETFYHVPARTYDIDICIFLDPEEKNMERFFKILVKVLKIRRGDVGPWDKFMEKIRSGQVLVIEPQAAINFHIDIIPITPKDENYAIFREAYENRIEVLLGKNMIYIPSREYWICLKLVGFREKDKYHLTEMLRNYNILGLRIDIGALYLILERYPVLKNRWMNLLQIVEKEYNLYVDKDGYVRLRHRRTK